MPPQNDANSFSSFIQKIKSHIPITTEDRVLEINREFLKGFEFIAHYPKSVTIYGGTQIKEGNVYYEKARSLGKKIVEELKCAVVTGGGPGIMEAANRGAKDAKGNSVGITIKLPHEQETNPYVTNSVDFYYFFVRRVILSFSAESCVFFPGGFGTLDEFFEILTLRQTHKIPPVPIILFGKEYWEPLEGFFRENLLGKFHTIREENLQIYKITDDENEVIDIVRKAPLQKM
ncbi:MAG: TIGR00730 family Rossman fold protein [Candidatus Pacebacteria bacterium]|nr:TIGR00730 family Rossman fold protein [Candidatus Paceibacterota bacterium]